MPLAPVRSATAVTATSQSSLTATFPAGGTATAGNLLVACANSDATISLPAGWTLVASVINFTGLYQWRKIAVGGETGITITPGATTTAEVWVAEYSGNEAIPLDKTATSNPGSNSATIVSGTTATLSQADELAIACFGWNDSTGTAGLLSSVDNSFTILAGNAALPLRGTDPTSMDTWLGVASRAVSATTALSTTGTLAGVAGRPVGIIATYKATATVTHERSASLAVTTDVQAVGQRDVLRSASLSVATDITAAAIFWSTLERSAALAVTTGIEAASQRVLQRQAALSIATAISTGRQVDFNRSAVLAITTGISVSGGKADPRLLATLAESGPSASLTESSSGAIALTG